MYQSTKNEKLKKVLPRLVIVMCALQPCLDVLAYISDKCGMPNIFTLFLRLVLLLGTCVCGFMLTERKKLYIIGASLICLYIVCHIGACMVHGYNDPIADVINLARIFQLPVMAVCFITFVKANEKVYNALRTGFVICLLLITAVEIISVITKTNPYTYENKSVGIIGWFNDSSAQSAILSTLVPVFAAWTVQKYKDNLPMMVLSVLFASLILFMYATRLAYISLIITLTGLAITLIISEHKSAARVTALLLTCVLFICLIPFSPMEKNQSMVADNAVIKQQHIDSLITGNKTEDLRPAYEYYMGGLVGRFGLERVAEEYNYSTDASDICDVRRMKKTYCSLLMEEQGITAMLFGMELADMTHDGLIHDVENDFHGIFYLTGGVGLLSLAIFLLYFVFIIIKALICRFKNVFNIESAGLGIALIINMLHAYATCGVLRHPGSSFYLCAILASVYFITNQKKGRSHDHQKDS